MTYPYSTSAAQPRIAVIDDDAVFLELMHELLGVGEGYEVFTCAQWVNSVDFIKRVQPDLVLLDLMLGRDQHGWAVLNLLRSDAETLDLPVILCTAVAAAIDHLPEPREARVEYVAKPFDIDDMLATIRRMLAAPVPAATADT